MNMQQAGGRIRLHGMQWRLVAALIRLHRTRRRPVRQPVVRPRLAVMVMAVLLLRLVDT